MIFVAAVDFEADMIDVEVNQIDDAVIVMKTFAIIRDVIGMTPWEVLAAGIAEIVVDNWGW